MAKAVIFAGGTGVRMHSKGRPKQFLELNGKPVLIYTLEHFASHEMIDGIVVVCKEDWIERLKYYLRRFEIGKILDIVPGGATAHESIYNGLNALRGKVADDEIVLIHDGVRPLITEELISNNVYCVREYGCAITAEVTKESIVYCSPEGNVTDVPPREQAYIAKAPQSFRYKQIMDLYDRAKAENYVSTDSCHLCRRYGMPMHIVYSNQNNIKITEPADFFCFKALTEEMEGREAFGL